MPRSRAALSSKYRYGAMGDTPTCWAIARIDRALMPSAANRCIAAANKSCRNRSASSTLPRRTRGRLRIERWPFRLEIGAIRKATTKDGLGRDWDGGAGAWCDRPHDRQVLLEGHYRVPPSSFGGLSAYIICKCTCTCTYTR